MANETMRIFFPLKIVTYPQGEFGMLDNPVQMTSSEAAAYEEATLAAIAKENRQFENDRGLAEYIHDEALSQKVNSLYPSVENVDGELWGVMTAGLKESLSSKETAGLLDFICGQNAEGCTEKSYATKQSKKLVNTYTYGTFIVAYCFVLK